MSKISCDKKAQESAVFILSMYKYFLGLQNHCIQGRQPLNSKMLAPWNERYDQPRQHIKKQRHHYTDKDFSKSIGLQGNQMSQS